LTFRVALLETIVDRPKVIETTALGAALLAGLGVGLWKSEPELRRARKPDRLFQPRMVPEQREALFQGWRRAMAAVRSLGS
jgi:glycerol kinase